MSKVSKTARASMGSGPVIAKSIIPDAELIRLLRIDRESGIFPGTQGTDALLRACDSLMADMVEAKLDISIAELDVANLKRQLILADSILRVKEKALTDIAAGID